MASFTVVLSVFFAITTGLPRYRKLLPNPDAATTSGIDCPQIGHVGCVAGVPYVNVFGRDFAAAGYKWTKAFCEKDSDGDGVSNGAELGDPCCNFVNGGTPSRSNDLSFPGEPFSKPKDPANHVCSEKSTTETTKLRPVAPEFSRETKAKRIAAESNPAMEIPTSTPTPSSSSSAPISVVTPSASSAAKPKKPVSNTTRAPSEVKSNPSKVGSVVQSASNAPKTKETKPVPNEVSTNIPPQSSATVKEPKPVTEEAPKENTSPVTGSSTSTETTTNARPSVSPVSIDSGLPSLSPIPSSSGLGLAPFALEESAEPSPNPSRVCFSADSTVTLESGKEVRMEDLVVGDRVLVSSGKYSEVFMFTHALRDVHHEFIVFHTESGSSISLTAGHYIYASGELVRASAVRKANTLTLADGTLSRIVKIEFVNKRGLFNPQTSHGDIVVNGVVASTYTEFVTFSAGHAMLSPLRALYTFTGVYTATLERGIEGYVG